MRYVLILAFPSSEYNPALQIPFSLSFFILEYTSLKTLMQPYLSS